MPFKKNHEYRWQSDPEKPLDKQPICFKGLVGQKEKLKSIPDWQGRLRAMVEAMLEERKPS